MIRLPALGALVSAVLAASPDPRHAPQRGEGLALDVYTADTSAFGVTSTLISGRTEAILVDAQFTISDARQLAERIAAKGKRLKAIVITHAPPDAALPIILTFAAKAAF